MFYKILQNSKWHFYVKKLQHSFNQKSKSKIYNVNIPHHLIQKVGIFRVTQQGKFGIPRSF